jgi:hypothetical protein
MPEGLHRTLDIAVKFAASAVTLIGLWFGYQQFISEFERSNKKPYTELQTKYYLEMLETVSKITYPLDDSERESSTKRFWQLYVGASALVEDAQVEDKINSISECIRKRDKCAQFELESSTLSLAQAMRTSLGKSWGLQ